MYVYVNMILNLWNLQNQREQNNDGQSVNDRRQNGDNEPLKQQQPQEDSEQQSGHHGEQQKNDEQQVDNANKNDCKKQEESQQSCNPSQPDNQYWKDPENKQIDGNKCTEIKVEGIDSDKTCKENNTTRED